MAGMGEMHPLGEYILGRRGAVSRRELNRLVDGYEWFTTARRARALLTGEPDPALTLPLGFWPTVPPATPPSPSVSPATQPASQPVPNVIDRFLEHGGYRIVPADEAPQVDVDIEIDPELVTEELADIYRAQGLDEKADEIYRILKGV